MWPRAHAGSCIWHYLAARRQSTDGWAKRVPGQGYPHVNSNFQEHLGQMCRARNARATPIDKKKSPIILCLAETESRAPSSVEPAAQPAAMAENKEGKIFELMSTEPLKVTCHGGPRNLDVLRTLLEKDPSLANARNAKGESILLVATRLRGKTSFVRALIDNGARIDATVMAQSMEHYKKFLNERERAEPPPPKAARRDEPAAGGAAKQKPPAATQPTETANKVKEESIEIVPDGIAFLNFLRDEIAGGSMGLLIAPSNEGSVCDQLHTLFLRKPWVGQCQIIYNKKRGQGKSNRKPDFQFVRQKALTEVKYKKQGTNALEHLLAQVCDYLANEDAYLALDVWTCYYDENGPGISFERDTDTQEEIDKLAGKDQGRKKHIEALGKTWPRLWRMTFR